MRGVYSLLLDTVYLYFVKYIQTIQQYSSIHTLVFFLDVLFNTQFLNQIKYIHILYYTEIIQKLSLKIYIFYFHYLY